MLVEVPGLRDLLPFMKVTYSSASSCVWADEEGGVAPSNSMGAGNQATPSCPCCSVWGYVKPSRKCGVRIPRDTCATTISWRASLRNGWQRSGNCGTQSHQSQTCNVRGRCSSSAQGLHVICFCTVQPQQCAGYAHGQDSGRQRMMEVLVGRIPGSPAGRRWHARPAMLHMKAC